MTETPNKIKLKQSCFLDITPKNKRRSAYVRPWCKKNVLFSLTGHVQLNQLLWLSRRHLWPSWSWLSQVITRLSWIIDYDWSVKKFQRLLILINPLLSITVVKEDQGKEAKRLKDSVGSQINQQKKTNRKSILAGTRYGVCNV